MKYKIIRHVKMYDWNTGKLILTLNNIKKMFMLIV